jgi:hypothetical protein
MKIKIIVSSALALFTGLVSQVQAQDDCCNGQPLQAGYACCNNEPILTAIYTCCTSSQESAWQAAYNSCKTDAQGVKSDDDNTAESDYNAVVNGCEWVANEDCSWAGNPSPTYTACYDSVMAAQGTLLGAALTTYVAVLAADETQYGLDLVACASSSGAPLACADGWTLTL